MLRISLISVPFFLPMNLVVNSTLQVRTGTYMYSMYNGKQI
jgi:hypothetical protein